MPFDIATLWTPISASRRPHGTQAVSLLLEAFLQREPPAMFCPCDATSLAWVPGTVVVALLVGSARAGRLCAIMPSDIDPAAPDLLRSTPLFVRGGHEAWAVSADGRRRFAAIRDRILPGIEAYERSGREAVIARLPAALEALRVPEAARTYHYMVHTASTLVEQAAAQPGGLRAGSPVKASERLLWPTRQQFGFSELDDVLRARLVGGVASDDLVALGHIVGAASGVMEARGYDARAQRLLDHATKALEARAERPGTSDADCTRLFDVAMELRSQLRRIQVGAAAPVVPEGGLSARVERAA